MTTKTIKTPNTSNALNILYSCRLRLTEEQRLALKEAHNSFRNNGISNSKATLAGSRISVSTAVEPCQHSYEKFGLSNLIVNDIIVARESVSLCVVLKLQELLGVEVVSRKDLETSFRGYLDYVYQN